VPEQSVSAAHRDPSRPVSGSIVAGILVVAAIAIIAAAWAYLAAIPKVLAIEDVLGNLREYDGQTVTVSGRVTDPLNIFGIKTYSVTDDTGTIQVVTERGLPASAAQVKVTGVVNQYFKLGSMEATVLLEPLPSD
jgi:hypothetical protein